jgi:hypothetical protein
MTFPLAIMEFQLDFFQTILWTNVGGILGVFFFAYLSEKILFLWKKYVKIFFLKLFKIKKDFSTSPKKVFTKKSRRIIRVKNKYGLVGIALITPILLSIPVGVFLVVRYFNRRKFRLVYLIGSNVIWSFLYALFYTLTNDVYMELFP